MVQAVPFVSPVDCAPFDLIRPFRWLRAKQRIALILLFVFAIGYGVLVEARGALIHSRHTDAGVYFSAAWSVRSGDDPYYSTDVNGWHYNYPLLLAVLLTPLADAPATMHRYWLLPYSVSIGIWYVLSIVFLLVGVDRLARALIGAMAEPPPADGLTDERFSDVARWSWRWWVLCFWPVLLCLPSSCRSVIRGQVGPLWLMVTCLAVATLIERKYFRSGLWIAAAICLKVMPAFMLIYALWRRNLRMLAGAVTGLIVGLIIIPWMAMGTTQFAQANRHYIQSYVMPGITGQRLDAAFEHELTNPVTSDTQSFVTVLMHMGHTFLGTEESYDPPRMARIGHWLIGGALTAMVLAAAGWRKSSSGDPLSEAVFLSLISVIALPIGPICHPHYFMLMLPLIAVVIATFLGPRGQPKVTTGWIALLAAVPLSHLITSAPGSELFRFNGLVVWVVVIFCVVSAGLMWRRTRYNSVQLSA